MQIEIPNIEFIDSSDLESFLITFFEQSMTYSWWGVYAIVGEPKCLPEVRYASERAAKHIVLGGRVQVTHDSGSEESEEGAHNWTSHVSLESVKKGLQFIAKSRKCGITSIVEDHDMNDADAVMQAAILGEVVFG